MKINTSFILFLTVVVLAGCATNSNNNEHIISGESTASPSEWSSTIIPVASNYDDLAKAQSMITELQNEDGGARIFNLELERLSNFLARRQLEIKELIIDPVKVILWRKTATIKFLTNEVIPAMKSATDENKLNSLTDVLYGELALADLTPADVGLSDSPEIAKWREEIRSKTKP